MSPARTGSATLKTVRGLSPARLVLFFCALSFVLRVLAVVVAPGHFWAYTVYYDMAKVLASGGGYCLLAGGRLCAYFPPVYPTILAAGVLSGHPQVFIAFAGALMGSGTVWLTWLNGERLFGPQAGLLAAGYASVYPYFVWHDAVLQESATLAFMAALAIYCLGRAHRPESMGPKSKGWALAGGAAIALGILTKANLLLFGPAALLCVALFSGGTPAIRARRAAWVAIGIALLLGPWMIRTWRITGSPILYSNGGFSLWTSNHRLTFDYFPERSIDDAHPAQDANLSPSDRHELESLGDDPQGIAEARWYWNRGMQFILANPGLTLRRDLQKVWVAFSPRFSPAKGGAFQALYFLSYFPLLCLALAGTWRTRARWRELGYIYAIVVTFAAGSAALWGHTSHRMYVEPCLMLLAAAAVCGSGHGTRERYLATSLGSRSTG